MGETCRFCDGPMTATNVRVVGEDLYQHCDPGDCIITLQGRTENLRSEVARLRAVVDAAERIVGAMNVAREVPAEEERAKVVAWLRDQAFYLSAQANVTDDECDANTMDDQSRVLSCVAGQIERGDHRRDREGTT